MNLKTTPSTERGWTSDSASGLAASSSGEDHSPANSLLVKVRSACNRCHGQKLRCVKRAGQAKCERCRKLHTLCKFSPRAPRLSLKHVEPAIDGVHEPFPLSPYTHVPSVQDNPIFENSDNCEWLFPPHTSTHLASQPDLNTLPNLCNPMQSDSCQMQDQSWSSTLLNSVMSTPDPFRSFDMDLVHLDSGTMSRENLLHPVSTPLSTRLEPPSKESIYSSSSAIRDLANLSIALHDCATKLPSMPEVGVFPPHISLREKQSARKVALFAIDELFGLTSEFIATMKRLSFANPETDSAIDLDKADNPRTESATPLLTFSQPLARSRPSARLSTNDQPPPFSQLDESTTLLIMSCHSRLIETYVSLFRMMHACLEFNVVPQLEEGAVIILPRLQVGSFAAPSIEVRTGTMPSPGTTSMYMLIITILSTKLCEQLAEAMQMGQEKDRRGEERGNGAAASDSRRGMWNTMNVGTDRLSREIDVTRRLLQQFPMTTP